MPLDPTIPECAEVCDRLTTELCAAGIEVIVDDRDIRPGVKFADNDLMGFPYQIVLGKRGLKNGTVELKDRATGALLIEEFNLQGTVTGLSCLHIEGCLQIGRRRNLALYTGIVKRTSSLSSSHS